MIKQYLNLNYYLNKYLGKLPEPPVHPVTGQPVGPQDLAPLFPMELIKQEVSLDEFVEIPEPVREFYRLYRPTPLLRARRLEKLLKTPARIYYKYEGASPAGSHKLNTALPQAYYNKMEGVKRLTTETGAGQWGSALAMACNFFGLECLVYMVKVSFAQKPYRKVLMQLFGAQVLASPSKRTDAGRSFLAKDAQTSGSLGMAISEAIEEAVTHEGTKYSLGSVLNYVLLHQTVIGQEATTQLAGLKEKADVVIGCCGGGSNLAGIAFPFIAEKLKTGKELRVIAVEPESCPSLTCGEYRFDSGDTSGLTPKMKMYTLGSDFMPDPIHAGGLRYHGAAPLISLLRHEKLIEARCYAQMPVFKAAVEFAKAEGIVPAPESAHAIRAIIDEAIRCRKEGKSEVLVFNLSGHGLLDLKGYEDYLRGKLK